eukprot:3402063-Amphidinium_carterae.1
MLGLYTGKRCRLERHDDQTERPKLQQCCQIPPRARTIKHETKALRPTVLSYSTTGYSQLLRVKT